MKGQINKNIVAIANTLYFTSAELFKTFVYLFDLHDTSEFLRKTPSLW